MSTGQNLFHNNSFIAFSSTRFCPTSSHVKTEKHKLVRHLQSGKAPLLAWDFWVAAHMSVEQKIKLWKVCLHTWWGDSLGACHGVFFRWVGLHSETSSRAIHTAPRVLPRHQAVHSATFQLRREPTIPFTQAHTFKNFSAQISIFEK